jgi:hypothetical protein
MVLIPKETNLPEISGVCARAYALAYAWRAFAQVQVFRNEIWHESQSEIWNGIR